MLVLGISDLEHDTATALLGERGPVAAVEEDKLSRTASGRGLPRLGIDYCLREASAQASDLSAAALATRPRRAWLRAEASRAPVPGSPPRKSSVNGAGLDSMLWKLSQFQLLRRQSGVRAQLLQFEHHLCHAASAFYPSDFDRALVLTLDESGDLWSGLVAIGEGTDLRALRPIRFPHSLGWLYSQVTELLGYRPGRDEHKVQWLSKEGSPDFLDVFRRIFPATSDGIPVLSASLAGSNGIHSGLLSRLQRDLHLSDSALACDGALRASIARSAQHFLEETVVRLAATYRAKTAARYLCVAGGVFLNVLLIRALEREGGFEKVFVQPVSGNAGSALGAACLARKHLANGGSSREALAHLYLGPGFSEEQIKSVLDNSKTIYHYLASEKRLLDETARLLREDKVVAWYQGRLEFGHRALGNRSILASPFSPWVKENLNKYVKHREDFHPFALSVPIERVAESFDCTDNCRFMASVGSHKQGSRELGRFAFNGGSVRVHTVEKLVNPRFWSLLHRFGEDAPAPALVNTSFNLFGEPLVCDPRAAVRSFFSSGIDALVMGNFLVVKP